MTVFSCLQATSTNAFKTCSSPLSCFHWCPPLQCRLIFTHNSDTPEDITTFQMKCRLYFNVCVCVLILKHCVTPTLWTIGHVPLQTQQLHDSIGLGVGTTQGREAKVLLAKKYLVHTTPDKKYEPFFQYDFIHLCRLSEYDPEDDCVRSSQEPYLPKGMAEKVTCHCGQVKDSSEDLCGFCRRPHQKLTAASAHGGKLRAQLD